MPWNRYRRAASIYLALFFLAVVAAPHHHLNGIEDILLDQPSDSGLLTQVLGPRERSGAPALNPIRLVQDEPCLACFTGDFVCAPGAAVAFTATLAVLAIRPLPPALAFPQLLPARTSSRAPPRIS
ncbi:MAG TPA: hypothetical protein VLO07_04925 [Thermoanaerobaculia bacterium]|nr:hypothetical protein [Thermoanaerobaculia bacterium]